jgi:putative endonuclease
MGERVAFVYLLRCGDTSLYCGWTFDVERRLAAHRSGRGARYTRSRLPLELAGVLAQPDAASARREEARIKRLPRGKKLELIARGRARAGGQPVGVSDTASVPPPGVFVQAALAVCT